MMTKIKNLIKTRPLFFLCMAFYFVYTFFRMLVHIPWFDEAHAYTIAEQLSFLDIIKYVKNEGHFFFWQAILFPFAKLHLYPYPMLILNWLFCTLALILMWLKAPFDDKLKLVITCSSPFIWCYSIIARCYSIGILLLFLLCWLFKDKLRHPVIYSVLLVLSANTSIVALFGASAFGFLFLYDLFKEKYSDKTGIVAVSSILILGAVVILAQLLNIGYWDSTVGQRTLHLSVKIFRNTFVYDRLLINLALITAFGYFLFRYFGQNKRVLFFISFSYLFLLILATGVYPCHYWHTYFFYIFLIIAFWLMDNQDCSTNIKKQAYWAFFVMSVILIIHTPQMEKYGFIYKTETKNFINFIENDENLAHAQIIQNDGLIYEMSPYSYGKSFKIKNYCHVEDKTEYDLWNISTQICPIENAMFQARRHPEILKQIVDGNTYTYIKEEKVETIAKSVDIKTKEGIFKFDKYKCLGEYCFWKITLK